MKRIKRSLTLTVALYLTTINSAFAYTDAEIDQMFKALKQENAELKQELETLKSKPSTQIQEQTVTPSTTQQKDTRLSYIKSSLEKQESKFKVNGFLTAGVVKSNPPVANQVYSFGENASFTPDSILGLQTTFILSDKTEITAQLVAKGVDDWDLNAEWAFLRYNYSDSLSFRAGRLRIPIYLYSESLEVGFSYPWIRPPAEVYQASINNYEGMDTTYTFGKGDRVHQIQFFIGNNSGDNFDTDILGGANITSYYGDWTARASVFTYDIAIEFAPNIPAVEDGAIFYTLGTTFDDGDWLFITELSKFDVDDFTIFSDTAAGYVTLGKYVGKFLPHLTYAKSYSTKEPVPRPPSFESNKFTGESYTLGLRYNLSYATSLKFEWAHYRDMDDTGGIWNRLPPDSNNVDIYSIALDAVF